MTDQRADIEAQIRAAFELADYERASTLSMQHYGPEILSFLSSQIRNSEAAGDVFAEFAASYWASLPAFEWRCTARTWAYKLARRAASHHRRRELRHRHAITQRSISSCSLAAASARTRTPAYRRTNIKAAVQELRATLPADEQALLILRVDRALSWHELAEVMMEGEQPASEAQLKTEAARLRKRFQLVKEKLRSLITEAGLLER